MLLKLNAVAARSFLPANLAWTATVAYFRSRKQRSRDRRILLNMNDRDLRDLGLGRSQGSACLTVTVENPPPRWP